MTTQASSLAATHPSAATSSDAASRRARAIAGVVFMQMLPATLLGPAIRPLFAARHAGNEAAMHAFMSLGMLGALVATPLVTRWADRGNAARARAAVTWMAAADTLLVLAVAAPLPTSLVLALRMVEGGAHVATSALLLAEASRLDGEKGGRALSLGGGALLAAVAVGSALGGALARVSVELPFVLAAILLASTACVGPRIMGERAAPSPAVRASLPWRSIALPLSAAFVERFGIGCMVVSFSLYARVAHHLDDAAIGVLYALVTVPFALLMVPLARLPASSRPFALAVGALGYALALVSIAIAPTFALAPLFLLAGVASAALYAPALRSVGDLAPTDGRARAMGAFHVAGCLGMLFGPACAGITSAIVRRHLDGEAPHQAALMLGGAVSVGWLACMLAVSGARRLAR